MSAPEQQHPGGADSLFLLHFKNCLLLSRAQGLAVASLNEGIVEKAHDFAEARMQDGLSLPALQLCRPYVYLGGFGDDEAGGLQLNFAALAGYRSRTVGVRVEAYRAGDPFVRESGPFTTYEAEDVARIVRCMAEQALSQENAWVGPDLTTVVGVPPIPVYYTWE